jgi:hypothetical protein
MLFGLHNPLSWESGRGNGIVFGKGQRGRSFGFKNASTQTLAPNGFWAHETRLLLIDFRPSISPLIKASFFLRVHRLI